MRGRANKFDPDTDAGLPSVIKRIAKGVNYSYGDGQLLSPSNVSGAPQFEFSLCGTTLGVSRPANQPQHSKCFCAFQKPSTNVFQIIFLKDIDKYLRIRVRKYFTFRGYMKPLAINI